MSFPDEFLLVVYNGLCKRKFVLYFCFVAIFAHFVAHFISSHVVRYLDGIFA